MPLQECVGDDWGQNAGGESPVGLTNAQAGVSASGRTRDTAGSALSRWRGVVGVGSVEGTRDSVRVRAARTYVAIRRIAFCILFIGRYNRE